MHVYPKVVLHGSTWTLILGVSEGGVKEPDLTFSVAAGVSSDLSLELLKIVFNVIVGDTDTAQDVLDALTADDIQPGGQFRTVASNWVERAENNIDGMPPGFTAEDFRAAQSKQDTSRMRADTEKALVDGRGWEVVIGSVHQHEGDGTVTDG